MDRRKTKDLIFFILDIAEKDRLALIQAYDNANVPASVRKQATIPGQVRHRLFPTKDDNPSPNDFIGNQKLRSLLESDSVLSFGLLAVFLWALKDRLALADSTMGTDEKEAVLRDIRPIQRLSQRLFA